jgi:hypothetical protein
LAHRLPSGKLQGWQSFQKLLKKLPPKKFVFRNLVEKKIALKSS